MLVYFLIFIPLANGLEDICEDKSPYCNPNDCTVRPGYGREFCKRTCGGCQDICEDSQVIACTDNRKKECDAMLKDYCPKLCGACRPAKISTIRRKPASIKTNSNTTSVRSMTTNASVAEKARTGAPFIFPPVFKSPEKSTSRRSPSRTDNEIGEEEIEWIHEPSPPPHSNQNSINTGREDSLLPMIPDTTMRYLPQPRPLLGPVVGHNIPWRPMAGGYGAFPAPMAPMGPARTQFPYPGQQRQLYPGPFGNMNNQMYNIYGYGMPYGTPAGLQSLVSMLGCRDKDPGTCSRVTEETCLSRPGFYLKLCPVKCKNCNGLQCYDSIKVDCADVRRSGGCQLPAAAEYCPRTCQLCPVPSQLSDSVSTCRDELETCNHLAQTGMCEQPDSKELLRSYCAKSCGFCRPLQYFERPPVQMRKGGYSKSKKTKKS